MRLKNIIFLKISKRYLVDRGRRRSAPTDWTQECFVFDLALLLGHNKTTELELRYLKNTQAEIKSIP